MEDLSKLGLNLSLDPKTGTVANPASNLNPLTGKPINQSYITPLSQSTIQNPGTGVGIMQTSNYARNQINTAQNVLNQGTQDAATQKAKADAQKALDAEAAAKKLQQDKENAIEAAKIKESPSSVITSYLSNEGAKTTDQLNQDYTNYYNQTNSTGNTPLTRTEWENQGRPTSSAIPKTPLEIENDRILTQQKEYQNKLNQALNGTLPLTTDQQIQIDSLAKAYDKMIQEQLAVNKNYEGSITQIGISAGRQRYAPDIHIGNVNKAIQEGTDKIEDLNNKKANSLASLREGFRTNNVNIIKSAYEGWMNAEKEINSNVQKMYDKVAEEQKALREAKAKIDEQNTKDVNEIVKNLTKNPGVPQDIINKVSGSKTLAEAVQNAGEYLQEGSGDVGNYLYYKRQAEAAGQTPVDFNTYQTMEANRKARATAIADTSGMTTRQNVNFMSITSKFQADQIMITANQAKTAIQIAEQAKANPKNAGDQLTILYTLVKNLDPNSAVREGELALAQTTQSYLGKWGTSLERIYKGQPISSQATKELADATISLAQKWEQAGVRREKQYSAQAQVAGVGDAFGEYLNTIERPYDSANNLIQTEQQAIDKVTTWVNQSSLNKTRYNELKKIAPNASALEIAQQLGLQ